MDNNKIFELLLGTKNRRLLEQQRLEDYVFSHLTDFQRLEDYTRSHLILKIEGLI